MEKRPYSQSKLPSRSPRSTRAQRSERLNQLRSNPSRLSPPPLGQPGAKATGQPRATARRTANARGRRPVPPAKVSHADLNQRRKSLRRRRGFNSLKGTWRLVAVGAAAVGLGWVMMQPLWVLEGPEQVRIKGIQTISEETLQSLLPLEYPQSLLKVKPQKLEAALLEGAPVNEVHVSRRLLPPGLMVQVVERRPVAIAELAINSSDTSAPAPAASKDKDAAAQADAAESSSDSADTAATESGEATPSPPVSSGASKAKADKKRGEQVLMDEAGDWIPLERYTSQGQVFQLPTLRVIGMRVEYRQAWSELYPTILKSPVEVLEIDWRDPSNLKLQTDVGEAHVGPYSSQFSQQLEVLDKMRELHQHKDAERVDFIDLRSPAIPRLKMKSE